MNQTPPWDRIYADPRFTELVIKRRKVTFGLFFICMIVFFSIPFLAEVAPDFLKIRLIGSINIGLLFVVAQYLVGGVIAWRYVVQLKKIDTLSKNLIAAFSKNA